MFRAGLDVIFMPSSIPWHLTYFAYSFFFVFLSIDITLMIPSKKNVIVCVRTLADVFVVEQACKCIEISNIHVLLARMGFPLKQPHEGLVMLVR